MQILNQLETEPLPIEEEEKRHTRRLLIGVFCAVLLTAIVLGGYLWLRKRHERQLAAAVAVESQKKTPKVEVLVDDSTVEGKKAFLGGTIHNISNESLRGIAIELQLRRRVGGGVETRTVLPESSDLAPDARTRYSLEVPSQDYISSTLLRVVSGENRAAVPFKALPGAARPPLETPASKTVIVNRPKPKGDEFINTPANPGKVP
ncbi:MAG TPA: hypothetical protein VEM96_08900 [Pyrinomonadaceae bacterium]|nr:hypothetical protein [Pyrinomonadaceae bacterium]